MIGAGPIVVFLGPTLDRTEASSLLDAVYLPPVAMGDVFRAVGQYAPRAIGIVDGFYEHRASVWHKEILWALSQGVAVYGAASMGALRAVELGEFGMQGVGAIFGQFRAGLLQDDDEVAVAHASTDGYRVLSDAMVNIRFALAAARAGGVISPPLHDRLVTLAKEMFYPQRTWPTLFRQAEAERCDPAQLAGLRDLVERTAPNQKRDDARALLALLARSEHQDAPGPRPPFDRTSIWIDQVERLNPAAGYARAPRAAHKEGTSCSQPVDD